MRCQHCSHQNSADAKFCSKCGRPLSRAPISTASGSGTGRELSDVDEYLASVDQKLEADLQQALASLNARITGAGAGPSPRTPLTPPHTNPVRDLPASRPLGPTVRAPWDWDKLISVPAKAQSRLRSLRDVAQGTVNVEVQHLDWLNYALFHANVSPVQQVLVRNDTTGPLSNPIVDVSILPNNYSEPWQYSIGPLASGGAWQNDGMIRLPLRTDRLKQVLETERASLRVSVTDQGQLRWTRTTPIDIHPYNHWILMLEALEFLAVFVTPNREAVQQIIGQAADLLEQRTGNAAFDGYQSESPQRVYDQVAALHDTLVERYSIQYINPRASFDIGQKIRFPSEIIDDRHGTCLDLSVLLAAMLEQVGLCPLIVIIPGHAFVACWNRELSFSQDPAPNAVSDARIQEVILNGGMLFFNSTDLCSGSPFEVAQASGETAVLTLLQLAQSADEDDMPFLYLVDVNACRREGVTPLP